ncbi:MAG TPA: GH92 family glycosyl hydrolase [Terriglobia bacterium]|nr:GH92 family glycosyl hydrolase [Terriglobia bacterium]
MHGSEHDGTMATRGQFSSSASRRRRLAEPDRAHAFSITMWAMVLLGFFSMATGALAGQNTVATSSEPSGLISNVNPFVGTGKGPGPDYSSSNENLFPGPVVPFGMVQLSPDTESHGFGYHHYQTDIQGFSMTHMSGVGCPNEGEVFFTATTGPVQTEIPNFQSPYSHGQESASPGYYQVQLLRWAIHAELTATERTGIARFTFPAGKEANILVPITHTLNQTAGAYVHIVSPQQIIGYVSNHIFCRSLETYKVYFSMTFSEPFASFGTWHGSQSGGASALDANVRSAIPMIHGQDIGAYVSWPAAEQPRSITVKIGISYVDPAGAENNRKVEAAGKDFDQLRRQAEAVWNRALGVIQVTGGTARHRRVFYTALYHCLLMPAILSDADGRYLGFDREVHHAEPGHEIYGNFSGWDIYRSEMPLLALIEPQRVEDMAQSIVLMYKQGGWIGRWPQINRYSNVMAGSPLTVVLCMAYLDGLHGFDIKGAWEGMLLDATEAPGTNEFGTPTPYGGQMGIQWINQVHYVPNDKISYGSVSQIQEDCIAYASLYRLAMALGKTKEAKVLYERALYYRNVFNHQDRFFRPRNLDGQWTPNFDPNQDEHGFIEGTGWDYQWLAPSDLAWLVQAMGKDTFNQRLTEFFNYKEPGWYSQYYNPYNETDLEAPFEFNFSGMPWETQRVVRRVLKENYTLTPDGIPGNDDCGQMSSWAILTMMGIYTVDPASLAYELVSPVFDKVVIHLRAPYTGKTFTIQTSADAESKPYIQSVQINGRAHQHNWISFHDLTGGGTLHFTLGSTPNKSWGAGADDAPPSLSNEQP